MKPTNAQLGSALSLCAVLALPLPLAADVDASGRWFVRGSVDLGGGEPTTGEILEIWTQNGTDLTSDDGQTDCPWIGTIDPMTGQFDQTRVTPPLMFPFDPNCGGYPFCGPQFDNTPSTRVGTVAMDAKTFSASGMQCVSGGSGCVCFDTLYEGSRCGNGVLAVDEECDDGNGSDGDGCSADCQVEPCFACAGDPSTCSPTPGTPCDDGVFCTTGDACDAQGRCTGSGAVGVPCDDGLFCTTSDACDAQGMCTGAAAVGMLCDDGSVCTTGDACDASAACTGAPLDCDDGLSCTFDHCDTVLGCMNPPLPRTCRPARDSIFAVRNSGRDATDSLIWKWGGAFATFAVLSDPTSTAAYRLCVYAGPTSAVVAEATVAPSAQAWEASGQERYRYRDPAGTQAGIRTIRLTAGLGDAAMTLRGKGANLPDPTLPLLLPVRVEIDNGDSGICWGATYDGSDVLSNGTRTFRAKAP